MQNEANELEVFEDVVEEFEMIELQYAEVQETVDLSTNSIVGLLNLGTMKMTSKRRSPNMVLVDCGVTHNFIDNK